ncbi:MAG: hypothetical protein E6G64_17060 [Actinobacteria bacterium]|nr:MAG: hypothetical protein E6G64_17060 [Actinomycetota bacterium]
MRYGGGERLSLRLLALLPVACCALPILLGASIGLTALAWGGAVAAAIAAAALSTVVLIRRRGRARHRHFSGANQERAGTDSSGPVVEVLYFDGCPNHVPALALIERVAGELGLEPELRLVKVADHEAAQRLRFLGSPTIRVGGRDVDPHTEERTDFGLSCRVFRTEVGIAGQPDERWVRDAFAREGRAA